MNSPKEYPVARVTDAAIEPIPLSNLSPEASIPQNQYLNTAVAGETSFVTTYASRGIVTQTAHATAAKPANDRYTGNLLFQDWAEA